jgi:hypothetical protein
MRSRKARFFSEKRSTTYGYQSQRPVIGSEGALSLSETYGAFWRRDFGQCDFCHSYRCHTIRYRSKGRTAASRPDLLSSFRSMWYCDSTTRGIRPRRLLFAARTLRSGRPKAPDYLLQTWKVGYLKGMPDSMVIAKVMGPGVSGHVRYTAQECTRGANSPCIVALLSQREPDQCSH